MNKHHCYFLLLNIMNRPFVKQPGVLEGSLAVNKTVTIDSAKFIVVGSSSVKDGARGDFEHIYVDGETVYYLRPIKSGGAAKKSRARIKPQPVLYPEEGLHSKWSAPRKRSEKISVDGRAPVNFLTENLGD